MIRYMYISGLVELSFFNTFPLFNGLQLHQKIFFSFIKFKIQFFTWLLSSRLVGAEVDHDEYCGEGEQQAAEHKPGDEPGGAGLSAGAQRLSGHPTRGHGQGQK